MNPPTIPEFHINFDKILEIVLTGIRRATIFMGLGLNAARNPDYKEYLLTKHTAINFVPTQVDDKTLTDYKANFGIWILGNGLREVNESFERFLSSIYEAVLFSLLLNDNGVSSAKLKETTNAIENFSKKKWSGQFEVLREKFEIYTQHLDCHLSLRDARNCLSHRSGRISSRDCHQTDSMTIKWMAMDFFISQNNQIKQMVEVPIKQQVLIKEGEQLKCKLSERNIKFPKGAVIDLSAKNVFEICLFYKMEAEKITNQAVHYAKQHSDIFDDPKEFQVIP